MKLERFATALLLVFWISEAHGNFFDHLAHDVEKFSKTDLGKSVIKGAAVGLLTGSPHELIKDLIFGAGKGALTHELLSSKVRKSINHVLTGASKDIEKSAHKFIKSNAHVVDGLNNLFHHSLSRIKRSARNFETETGYHLPEQLRNRIIFRSLGSAAFSSGIEQHMTKKLAADLAMKTHKLSPMIHAKMKALEEGIHALLKEGRSFLEHELSKVPPSKTKNVMVRVDSFLNHMIASLPHFHGSNAESVLERIGKMFSAHVLKDKKMLSSKVKVLEAAVKRVLWNFVSRCKLKLKALINKHKIKLNHMKFQQLLDHSRNNIHSPMNFMDYYLGAQRDMISHSLSSRRQRRLIVVRIPVNVMKKYVERLLRDMSFAIRKEIPTDVNAILRQYGVPPVRADGISRNVHRNILGYYFQLKNVTVRLHLDPLLAKQRHSIISAKIAIQVARLTDINPHAISTHILKPAHPGVFVSITIRTCHFDMQRILRKLYKAINEGHLSLHLLNQEHKISRSHSNSERKVLLNNYKYDKLIPLPLIIGMSAVAGMLVMVLLITIIIRKKQKPMGIPPKLQSENKAYKRLHEET